MGWNAIKHNHFCESESVKSKVIFTDKSRATFDGPDERTKRWILSNSAVPVAKSQQRGRCVIIWTTTVDQIIMESFKFDEGFQLNGANYCDFMGKTSFACLVVSKVPVL